MQIEQEIILTIAKISFRICLQVPLLNRSINSILIVINFIGNKKASIFFYI